MSEDLGLFHSQLLDYLEKNALTEQCADLFEDKNPIHFERKLLESFHLPNMYRGLPRLYDREMPAKSRVKKEFTDLSSLKRLVSERELFQIYEKFTLPLKAKICFFTWVIWDGWGDYIAAFEVIDLLKKKFPLLEMDWVVLVCSRKKLPHLPTPCKTHTVFYEKDCPLSLIDSSILQILRSSHLILQIPTYYPCTQDLCEVLKEGVERVPKLVSVGEYGFLESQWFHPKTSNRSMGLHFLEKGILIRENLSEKFPSFQQVENRQLVNWLFPQGIDEESYLAAHHFYVAYLATPIGGAVYLHALLKAHEFSEKTIDICCPDIGWFIAYLEMQNKAGRPILESLDSCLEVYTQEKIYTFGSESLVKKVRIFSPGIISISDFHILIQLSGEFVGVRGNQSFSEAISLGKLFFYDGRNHARYFLKDLLALAENRIASYPTSLKVLRAMREVFLYNLEKEEKQWIEEIYFQEKRCWKEIALELGQSLQDPKVVSGFKQLAQIIQEEHSFNDFFCQLIQRELCHVFHPLIARFEEECMEEFLKEKISFSELIDRLKREMNTRFS